MSVLILLLSPRPRGASAPVAADTAWAFSADGSTVQQQGRGGPATWPRADSVVALLADGDVAWHRVTLPKAPASRLRQALLGVLEDHLLDDEQLHFALPPDATPGRPVWVAVLHKPWLVALLAALEASGRSVDRLVAAQPPGAEPAAHFSIVPATEGTEGDGLQLTWSGPDGAAVMALAGSLARARVTAFQATAESPPRWTATPPAAAAAEAWLGQPVAVLPEPERALAAVRAGWNLRQFDLTPRHRGATAVREAWRRFMGREWRPVRVGLAALVAVQLIGLNAWAWQEQRALAAKRTAMVELFRTTFPKTPAVLDAPLQMARETALLRTAAGQPGETDLETLLNAAAAAWPEDDPPVPSLRFEPGKLAIGVPDWDPGQVEDLREQLRAGGWLVALEGGVLTVTRAPGGTP